MHHIIPHQLWIGHAGDGRAFRDIFANGIRAVVQLAIEEPPVQTPRELIALRFPLLDGQGNDRELLRLAIETVASLIDQKIPTLVCCGGGMSRSPVIAAAAIAVTSGTDLHACLQEVVKNHPADVSAGLVADVQAVLGDVHH